MSWKNITMKNFKIYSMNKNVKKPRIRYNVGEVAKLVSIVCLSSIFRYGYSRLIWTTRNRHLSTSFGCTKSITVALLSNYAILQTLQQTLRSRDEDADLQSEAMKAEIESKIRQHKQEFEAQQVADKVKIKALENVEVNV